MSLEELNALLIETLRADLQRATTVITLLKTSGHVKDHHISAAQTLSRSEEWYWGEVSIYDIDQEIKSFPARVVPVSIPPYIPPSGETPTEERLDGEDEV